MYERNTEMTDVQTNQHGSTNEGDDHPDIDEILDEVEDEDEELVETPLDVKKLSLNPGHEKAPRNPLCPVCEEQIRPVVNHVERRFICGCETIWQFTFDRDVDVEADN